MRGIDYYELLGVSRTASSSEIRSAYRTLAKAMHPDAGGTTGTFRLLREAYETLTDPELRAGYDGEQRQPIAPAPPQRNRRRAGRVGADPDHVPSVPTLSPASIPWWDTVGEDRRLVVSSAARPDERVVLAAAGGWLVPLVLAFVTPASLLAVWLPVLAGTGVVVAVLVRRHLAARRADRAFRAEFGARAVFGKPGTDPDQLAERLTADLLAGYLTRLPGVRIFHGLAGEAGSVFADIDHAVLCGRRLVLIESKLWLPGHYEVDEAGELLRNGHRFRGGAVRLPRLLDAYRALLPDLEIRGVLLLYPSRAGEITVGDEPAEVQPLVPERFVRETGDWLATDPSTVDRVAFRTLLSHLP